MTSAIHDSSPMIASIDTLIELTRARAKTMRVAQHPGGSRHQQGDEDMG